MCKSNRWQRWLVASVLAAMCALPQMAMARGRGQNIPFVITAQGPIRKSDYYGHLMSPQQREAQRKLEDDFIAKQKGQKPTGKTSSTTTPKKK